MCDDLVYVLNLYTLAGEWGTGSHFLAGRAIYILNLYTQSIHSIYTLNLYTLNPALGRPGAR